jgi:hypothetical protein
MGALKDAFKKAFAEAGKSLPEQPKIKHPYKTNVSIPISRWSGNELKQTVASTKILRQPSEPVPKTRNTFTDLSQNVSLPKSIQMAIAAKPVPKVSLQVIGKTSYRVIMHSKKPRKLLNFDSKLGSQLQLNEADNIVHDITIGLDFGTSSVKAVVGDASQEKYFAVPFVQSVGIDEYLLPCRLFVNQADDICEYSLISGERVVRDLKLALLSKPESLDCRVNVVAFLGLILRHIRGWLFTKHADVYQRSKIYWKVSIGLPSEARLNNQLVPVFERVMAAAWMVSRMPGPINKRVVSEAINSNSHMADLEVTVIPELSAQIYGFVASTAFDKNKINRYSIVDIGAGTVDASVFDVVYNKSRWDFVYYSASVQPNGVANLHSHRVDWWVNQLQGKNGVEKVLDDLKNEQYNTDIESPLPEDCFEYLDGIRVDCDAEYVTPDVDFFNKLVRQVQGDVLWRCWNKKLLNQNDLTGMPMFVCGGGSRMNFYRKLTDGIGQTIGAAWLRPEQLTLAIPPGFECPGVVTDDYDRLSVAYGLSRMDLGKIESARPLAETDNLPQSSQDWTDRYVDKDQC